eukprot:SAG31_NODE_5438_length_2538_cov_3.200082_3_plen_150_part_00
MLCVCSDTDNISSGSTCLTCDEDALKCEYVCLAEGEICNNETVSAKEDLINERREEAEEKNQETKQLAFSIILTGLVLLAATLHQMHLGWLQESMAFILIGIVLGLMLLLIKGGSARSFFINSATFDSGTFFLILLPPIIFVRFYHNMH